jgi:hypothetical protein
LNKKRKRPFLLMVRKNEEKAKKKKNFGNATTAADIKDFFPAEFEEIARRSSPALWPSRHRAEPYKCPAAAAECR